MYILKNSNKKIRDLWNKNVISVKKMLNYKQDIGV